LFLTILLPGLSPEERAAAEVSWNVSSVRLSAPPYSAELVLREDVVPDRCSWTVVRGGVKLRLEKVSPHAFDRLLSPSGHYPKELVSADALLPHLTVPEEVEERGGLGAAPPASAAVLRSLLAKGTTALLDARYSWCHLGGFTHADFDALATAVGTGPAFLQVDLREEPWLARLLGSPPCAPRTHAYALTPPPLLAHDGWAGVSVYPIELRPSDGSSAAAAIRELMLPPVQQLSTAQCDADGSDTAEWVALAQAAAVSAAASSVGGASLLVTGLLSASQHSSLVAAAESPALRPGVRVLTAAGCGAQPRLRLLKPADDDEPAADADHPGAAAALLSDPLALIGWVALYRRPLAPLWTPQLRLTLERAALPTMKLFLRKETLLVTKVGAKGDAAAAVADAFVSACAALRSRVACARYDSSTFNFELRYYGWMTDELPAVGLSMHHEAMNATRFAFFMPPNGAGNALRLWAMAALDGHLPPARLSERVDADAAASLPLGVDRLSWRCLEALLQPAIVLVHSSFAEEAAHSAGDEAAVSYGAVVATLGALADMLRVAPDCAAAVRLGALRSDANYLPTEMYPPTERGALFLVRPRAANATSLSLRSTPARMLRALQRAAPDVCDWEAVLVVALAASIGSREEL